VGEYFFFDDTPGFVPELKTHTKRHGKKYPVMELYSFLEFSDTLDHWNGAGYAYPKDLLRRHPNAKIDVVEIDPGMTKAAEEYFELPQTHRLSIYHEDGRVFLLRNNSLYDVIYIDAFGELITPPFHLLTKEMFELAKKRISDNGILVMNIIGAYEGPRAKLLSAIQKTAADVFSSVQLYPVGAKAADQTQNIILVASSNPLSQVLPGTKDSALKEDVSLFTDT